MLIAISFPLLLAASCFEGCSLSRLAAPWNSSNTGRKNDTEIGEEKENLYHRI
jgi:hypothetical protein